MRSFRWVFHIDVTSWRYWVRLRCLHHSSITRRVPRVLFSEPRGVALQFWRGDRTEFHLQSTSDLVIVQRNDNLHEICSKRLGIKKISLQDINRVIAHKLASVLQPAMEDSFQSVNTLSSMVTTLGSHPAYKLASIKCIPHISDQSMAYSTFVWPALLKHMRQMLIADAVMEEGIYITYITSRETRRRPPS